MKIEVEGRFGQHAVTLNLRNARSASADTLGGRDIYCHVWQGDTLVTLSLPLCVAVALAADIACAVEQSLGLGNTVSREHCVDSVSHQHRERCERAIDAILYDDVATNEE